MSSGVWSQLDTGIALVLGAIIETAAIRKLQSPRVFARTLERLDPALNGRRTLTRRWAWVIAGYEAVVGLGVIAFRGGLGFFFSCAVLVACTAFLVALGRAVQQSVPCACFGKLGRTAAGGREIARALALLVGGGFLVVHRAFDASSAYGTGAIAVVTALTSIAVIAVAQRIGAWVRPGVELGPGSTAHRSFAGSLRRLTGYDSELYSTQA